MTSTRMALASEDLPPQNQGDPSQTTKFPIAIKPTSNSQEQDKPVRPNKYIYPEFAGYSGEHYLNTLLQEILPYALWRTWHFAVSFQAAGNMCYVGTTRLAERVKPGRRKVEIDLQELEGRGLMRRYTDRVAIPQEDGTFLYRAVVVKDFSPLYELAYGYHLWINSPEYIPAEREYEDFFRNDSLLLTKMMKYDNYRHMLCCQKPGPKPKEKPLHLAYQRQFPQPDQELCPQGKASTDVLNQNLFLQQQLDTPSLYRIENVTERNVQEKVSIFSTAEKETVLESGTIGKTPNSQQLESDRVRRASHTEQTLSNPKPKTPPTLDIHGGGTAKPVERIQGYTEEELKRDPKKRGAAVAGIPVEHYIKLTGGKDQVEREEQRQRESQAQEKRPEREVPAQIVKEVTAYAQQYDDAHLIPADITRAAKIYFTAAQALNYFNDNLYWTFFDEANKAAKKLRGCEHTNGKGRVNRVPYFFTCFENAFSFSLEELVYLRTEDPLYTDLALWDLTNHLRETYQLQWNSGETRLDYREWLQGILDQLEQRKQPKQRSNRTTRE